jgi:uncharacterized protein (TIGR03790 family)
MSAGRSLVVALLLLGLFRPASLALAVGPENVLVLYNLASPEGVEIANYYSQVHPGVHLLGLNGLGTSESITANDYLSTIRPQVLSALTPSTDVIVTTKGLPLRIQVTQPAPPSQWPNAPTYTDAFGVNRAIASWKPYSSLESELANIDRVASWKMMGDQSYSIGGHFAANPYYGSNASFSHAATGTRLSSRLDGFNVADVEGSIDRAQNAFIGPTNSTGGPFHILVDNDPSKSYGVIMSNLVNNVLTPAGIPVTYDNTTAFVTSTPGPLMGYVSHGANQTNMPQYPAGEGSYIINGLNIAPANGAVFHTWESFNAETFVEGGNHGQQSLIGEWIAEGGTVATGHVQEPSASWSTVTNEDKMFEALLEGKTWAEAAWGATRQLSFVNTVIGDPLMTWKQLLAGDANMDGRVDMIDLATIGANWGDTVTPGGAGWYAGDLNSDGIVDVLDLALMGDSWGQVSPWASDGLETGGLTAMQFAMLFDESHATPEPSGCVLLALAIGALAHYGYRRRGLRSAVR